MHSLKTVHWILILFVIVAITIVSLYFSKAEAVYTRTVGTISVTKFVPNAGSGIESVTLAFSGIMGQASQANLNGWAIQNSTGFKYDLSTVNLNNTESVKICEEGASDPNCDYFWTGVNVFNDNGDALKILSESGVVVIYIPYESSFAGQTFSESGNYEVEVYTSGDKITICELSKNGTLKLSNANVQKITRDIETDITAAKDIIPPFVYERNKALAYHPGVNWPAGKNILASGCN